MAAARLWMCTSTCPLLSALLAKYNKLIHLPHHTLYNWIASGHTQSPLIRMSMEPNLSPFTAWKGLSPRLRSFHSMESTYIWFNSCKEP